MAKNSTTKTAAKTAAAKGAALTIEADRGPVPGRGWHGGTIGLPAARLWIAVFQANRLAADSGKAVTITGPKGTKTIKRPLSDDGITALFLAEYGGTIEEPVCTDIKPGRIAAVRSLYNGGRLRPQAGQRPAVPTGRFEEDGTERTTSRGPRAAAPAAPIKPARKPAAAPAPAAPAKRAARKTAAR